MNRIGAMFLRNKSKSSSLRTVVSVFRPRWRHPRNGHGGGIPMWNAGVGLAALLGLYGALIDRRQKASLRAKEAAEKEFTYEDVAKHTSAQTGIWVTYEGNVYDITDYVSKHPGGQIIMTAAGKDIAPFWAPYASHTVTKNASNILSQYKIGKLSASSKPPVVPVIPVENPAYKNDPVRHPSLKPFIKTPWIAEPPSEALGATFYTPAELWYVVNHLPVPDLDAKSYSFEVAGEGITKPVKLSIVDLKNNFPVKKLSASLQCGGNRRTEMTKFKPTVGIQWGPGSICTAEFTGVLLSDVLKYAGFDPTKVPKVRHIQFEGMDTADGKSFYDASIPVEKAMSAEGDVMLAWEMNGKPLTRDHGYPLRVVVPGTCAVRSVKWLKRISPSPEEAYSFWQRTDYKAPRPNDTPQTVNFKELPAIQDLPVTSAITEPRDGTKVSGSSVDLKGYAWSGAGRAIARVDLTTDDGETWSQVEMLPPPISEAHRRAWAWKQWKATVPAPAKKDDKMRVCVKAVDDCGNTQPESCKGIWNFKGYNVNQWACVNIVRE